MIVIVKPWSTKVPQTGVVSLTEHHPRHWREFFPCRGGNLALLPPRTFPSGYIQGTVSGSHLTGSRSGKACTPQPHYVRLRELEDSCVITGNLVADI